MNKKQKLAKVQSLENDILSVIHSDESLINYVGVRNALQERKQLLDSLFEGTEEELEQFRRVNRIFLKYEEKIPELILDLKHKTERTMQEQNLTSYANVLTAGVALLLRSNLAQIDKMYSSKFYDMFWVLHDINKQDDGFVHCYEKSLHHPFMADDPEEEFRRRLANNQEPVGFSHSKLNGIDRWSHTLDHLLNHNMFSIPDVLGLDHGQLFTHNTEFHSFDAVRYYGDLSNFREV